MSATDDYADWDAAYVLGALPVAERREYESHLAGCAACRAAVAELAGMPGLLAQLPPGEVLAMDLDGDADLQPPVSLMPVLPQVPAESPGRLRWLAPLAAAAAALLIGGVGGYAASSAGRDGSPNPGVTATAGGAGGTRLVAVGRLAFTPVEPSLMTAVVDVVPIPSGTELRVECQYARQPGGTPTTWSSGPTATPSTSGSGTAGAGGAGGAGGDYRIDYAIWVVDRAGRATQLRDWTARPDRIMRPVGVSALPVAQIASVEIRQVDNGHTVMRASLT